MVLLKDEENARSTIADVLNLSSDYSIHFTESHTDGPRKKKKSLCLCWQESWSLSKETLSSKKVMF